MQTKFGGCELALIGYENKPIAFKIVLKDSQNMRTRLYSEFGLLNLVLVDLNIVSVALHLAEIRFELWFKRFKSLYTSLQPVLFNFQFAKKCVYAFNKVSISNFFILRNA